MTTGGWVFLLLGWGSVTWLTWFSFKRLLSKNSKGDSDRES